MLEVARRKMLAIQKCRAIGKSVTAPVSLLLLCTDGNFGVPRAGGPGNAVPAGRLWLTLGWDRPKWNIIHSAKVEVGTRLPSLL